MRKLILYIATSLDGYIARKDDSLDWLPPIDEHFQASYDPFIKDIDVILIGSENTPTVHQVWPLIKTKIMFKKSSCE